MAIFVRESAASSDSRRGPVGRARLLLGVAVVAAGGGMLTAALLVGHAIEHAPPGDLPFAGAGTEWALPIFRLIHDSAAVLTVGFLVLAVSLLPPRDGQPGRAAAAAQSRARVCAACWLVAAVVEGVLNLSLIAAAPVSQVLSIDQLWTYFTQVPEGQAGLGIIVACAALLIALPVASLRWATQLLGIAVVALLLPALFTGHSAASSDHVLASGSLAIHVGAAALWIGGLAAVSWLAITRRPGLDVALPRFSSTAFRCFIAVGLSGVLNAGLRMNSVSDFWQTRYGVLALGKATLFVTLGAFGYLHRQRTVTSAAGGDLRAFCRLAAVELVVMAATLGLAVALSRSPTPTGHAPGHIGHLASTGRSG